MVVQQRSRPTIRKPTRGRNEAIATEFRRESFGRRLELYQRLIMFHYESQVFKAHHEAKDSKSSCESLRSHRFCDSLPHQSESRVTGIMASWSELGRGVISRRTSQVD